MGTQGFSPRTRADQQLVRFGASGARIALAGDRGGRPVELEVTLQPQAGKRAKLNGAPLRSAEQLRGEVATLVFTPDRLAVVKGGPAARRAYFDRDAQPAAAEPRGAPARVRGRGRPAERSASAGRVRSLDPGRRGPVDGAGGHPRRLSRRVAARRRSHFSRPFSPNARTSSACPKQPSTTRGEPPTTAALEARLERDLERGVTGLGPHLDDVTVRSGERELRSFGSQGEQRLAVLSLLLAEAEVIAEQRRTPPLVLLDDVLSELDAARRRALAERIGRVGQAIVTATSAEALPLDPAQLLEVTPGAVSVG